MNTPVSVPRLPRLRRPVGWRDLDAATVESRALAVFLSRYAMGPALDTLPAPLDLPSDDGADVPPVVERRIASMDCAPEGAFAAWPKPLSGPSSSQLPALSDPEPPAQAWSSSTSATRPRSSQAWLWVVALVLALVQALWLAAALLSRGPAAVRTGSAEQGAEMSRGDSDASPMSDAWPSWLRPKSASADKQVPRRETAPRDPNSP